MIDQTKPSAPDPAPSPATGNRLVIGDRVLTLDSLSVGYARNGGLTDFETIRGIGGMPTGAQVDALIRFVADAARQTQEALLQALDAVKLAAALEALMSAVPTVLKLSGFEAQAPGEAGGPPSQ